VFNKLHPLVNYRLWLAIIVTARTVSVSFFERWRRKRTRDRGEMQGEKRQIDRQMNGDRDKERKR
jgi:hypothetical protein